MLFCKTVDRKICDSVNYVATGCKACIKAGYLTQNQFVRITSLYTACLMYTFLGVPLQVVMPCSKFESVHAHIVM